MVSDSAFATRGRSRASRTRCSCGRMGSNFDISLNAAFAVGKKKSAFICFIIQSESLFSALRFCTRTKNWGREEEENLWYIVYIFVPGEHFVSVVGEDYMHVYVCSLKWDSVTRKVWPVFIIRGVALGINNGPLTGFYFCVLRQKAT